MSYCTVLYSTKILLGATVTNCDICTEQVQKHTLDADILVVATGHPELVRSEWIKPGAVVLDVGFHVDDDANIVGDVHTGAANVASLMTPVPGGVGPLTCHMLLENTVDAFVAQTQVEE